MGTDAAADQASASTPLAPVDLPVGLLDIRLGVAFHTVVVVVVAAVLALPAPQLGVRVLALVIGYHVGLLLVSRRPDADGWLTAWAVLTPLSVLMVVPDWFLSEALSTLTFPDTGAPFVGTVPLFMAGMWVMALFPLVLVGATSEHRRGPGAAVLVVAVVGLALFWVAELLAPVVPLWEPQHVNEVAGVAGYVLPAEALLCVGAWLLVRGARARPRRVTALGVVLLPLVYLGAMGAGYLVLG